MIPFVTRSLYDLVMEILAITDQQHHHSLIATNGMSPEVVRVSSWGDKRCAAFTGAHAARLGAPVVFLSVFPLDRKARNGV